VSDEKRCDNLAVGRKKVDEAQEIMNKFTNRAKIPFHFPKKNVMTSEIQN
jgi:hypothetical protein